MQRTLFSILSLAVCLLGATFSSAGAQQDPKDQKKVPPVIAQALKGTPEDFIKRFDRDKDGMLSREELPPRLVPLLERFDTNGDGKLDKKEVTALFQFLRQRFGTESPKDAKPAGNQAEVDRVVASLLERMDTNKDGKISREEAKANLAQNFDRFDTNKDGYLDKAELRRAAQQFLANQGKAGAQGGARPQQGPRPGPDFDALDKNADGRLTREELQGTPFFDKFDQIDKNKDGKIDRKEFEAYLKKEAEKKGT